MAEGRVVDTLFGGDDAELETLVGSAENDILALAPGVAGFILGAKGDDSILGGTDGTDPYVFAYGGKGDDTLSGRGSDDKFRGDKGEDSLFGGEGDETLYGGKDDDEIFGNDGADSILGDLGNDSIETDFELSDQVTDTLLGGEGNDTMGHLESDFDRESNAGDFFFGQEGEDSIAGGFGDDSVYGGEGADTLRGGNGDTTVDFLDNVPDRPFVPAGNDLVVGNDGDDFIQGGDEVSNRVADAVFERNLPDREPGDNVAPRIATDTLIGGDGADTIEGNDGDDSIQGDEGGDSLRGGDGTDTIKGGPGDDRLFGDTNAFVPGYTDASDPEIVERIATAGENFGGPDEDRFGRGDEYFVPPASLFLYQDGPIESIVDDILTDDWEYAHLHDSRLLAGGSSTAAPEDESETEIVHGFWAEDTFGESLRGGNDDDTLVGGASRDTLTGDGDPNTLGEDRFVYNTSEMLISVTDFDSDADGKILGIDATFIAPNPVQMADIVTDFQPGGGTGADTFMVQSFSYRELNFVFNSSGILVDPNDPTIAVDSYDYPTGDLVNVADSFGGTQAQFGQVGVDEVYDPITDKTWTLVYVELSPTVTCAAGPVTLLDPGTGDYYDPVGFDPGFDAAIAFLSNEVSPSELSASDFEFITGPTIS